jgi:hypothetical protein
MPLTNILHPNRYHGFIAQAPFFEGWCYKLISADGKLRYAVIPGVCLSRDPATSHCFVVVSMDHQIQGRLKLGGKQLDFSDGQGYIEKDWGKYFPSAWIWGQSNHFDKKGH